MFVNRVQPLRRIGIQPFVIGFWSTILGLSVAGCEEPSVRSKIDGTASNLLVGTSMFVTDEDGNPTAVWLGHVKIYSGPPISDSMLGEFTTMGKLTALYVTNDNISDGGMKHLARMTQLEVLDLRRTSITDGGLRHLESLQNLKVLCLAETRVTDTGVDRFKLAAPDCDVRR